MSEVVNVAQAGSLGGETPEYRLRKAIKAAGLTQVGLAKKAKVAATTVNRILQGQKARHQTKRKILKVLGIAFQGHRYYFR